MAGIIRSPQNQGRTERTCMQANIFLRHYDQCITVLAVLLHPGICRWERHDSTPIYITWDSSAHGLITQGETPHEK